MAGFDNDVVYGTNLNFSTANATGGAATMVSDGQLLIGRTSVNAGGTHIDVNTLTAGTGVSITNGPGSITLAATGSVPLSFTEDTGTATPAANNLNVLGQQAGTTPVMATNGAGSTVKVEDRTWTTSLVVDPSSTVGLRGTFSTIASALAAAVSGQNIFIRPGTYTENIQLVAGVNLTAYNTDPYTPTVVIVGQTAPPSSGTVNISGIQFRNTGSGNIFNGSGLSCAMNFTNCVFNNVLASANGFVVSGSSTTAVFTFYNCLFTYGTNVGQQIRNIGGATFTLYNCIMTGTGSATQFNCNTTSDVLNLFNCNIQGTITTSTSANTFVNTKVDSSTNNTTAITCGNLTISNCYVLSGSAVAIHCSSSTTTISNTIIDSTNANAVDVTVAGTLNYSGLVFSNTGINVSNAAGTVNTLPGQIVTITGSLTNAQIKALHGTPVVAIPAPGAGKAIQVVSASAKMVYGGTNVFTAGAAQTINLYYGTATSIAAVLTNAEIVAAATQFNGVNGSATFGGATTGFENTAVNLYNPIATEITGNAANNNTVTYQITYQVVQI